MFRAFAKCNGNGQSNEYTRLIKITHSSERRDVRIHLPESEAIVAVGWAPEIVYKMKEASDILDVVLRPTLAPFLEKIRTGSKAEMVKETAGTPDGNPTKEAVMYEVTFTNRKVKVNGCKLSRPNFNSENEIVFSFLMKNPNRKIDLAEIEKAVGQPLMKKMGEIIRDLGFVRELRQLFFHDVSKNSIRFINPVTRKDFNERELKAPSIGVK